MADIQWREDQPIYVQIRERLVSMILDGRLSAGDALPSVRSIATELQVNPLTAMKAYQSLVDEGIVEKRRGMGMFCLEGAREKLLNMERQRFLEQEWPHIRHRIENLGLDVEMLMETDAGDENV
jgi:GntR family transcriptional regulator